jgi:hypothetical protein
MDLLQYDQLASVGDIADRIAKVHAERAKLLPSLREIEPGRYDIDGAKSLLHDIRYGWSYMEMRGRRALLLQLVDGVHIDAGGIRIVWPFE